MNYKTSNPVIFISGDKLILRPLCESDLERMVVWINDPQIRKFITTYLPMTMKQEKGWLDKMSSSNKNIVFAVIKKHNGEHIGNMGIQNIDWRNGTATFGFMIGEKGHWRKGYGTEMLELMLEYVFNTLRLRRVESCVLDPNEGSIKVHKMCGFKQIGIFNKKYLVDGKYLDEILFELLKEDWMKI